MSTDLQITEPHLWAPQCCSCGVCIQSVMVSAWLLLLKSCPAWIAWLFIKCNLFISPPVFSDCLPCLVFLVHSPALAQPLQSLFFLPLPVAQVSLCPQGKLPLPLNSPRSSCCFSPPQLSGIQLCWVQLSGGISLCPGFCLSL